MICQCVCVFNHFRTICKRGKIVCLNISEWDTGLNTDILNFKYKLLLLTHPWNQNLNLGSVIVNTSHGIYVLLKLGQDFVVRKLVRKQGINIHAACVPKTWGIVQLYCHLQFLICLKQFYWLKSKWRNHLHSDDNPLEKEQRKVQTNIRKVMWFDLWHENQ